MHIIGAGGHAKVIIDILLASNQEIKGVWDENSTIKTVLNHPVIGNFAAFKAGIHQPVIIAIGNNLIRNKIAKELAVNFGIAIHPKCAISTTVNLGAGTVVMANASINADVIVGRHVIINTNASIDHDCEIGDFVHISPQVGLGGNVQVGEGTHIGIGASVKHGIKIGKWVTIGAGAVVIRDIPDYAVAIGNPTKIIKYNSI
ncbi:MAG: acetyltransferase [Pedobacter sp.]|jgi:acetyltransferase EpsM|uniref:acetyltransferase n=1 Tax=Pedobacter sp. TaxID=1411316 RepID=UPI00356A1189